MILACKLGGSPSLLWFRAPGRDKLGDNGKKTLLLCLLCSLQTSPWSVGPWLIPTAISKRRHKMSIIFMTRMKDKRVSQVSISSHPSAILEEQAQNTVIKMALQKMNCDRINASARWWVTLAAGPWGWVTFTMRSNVGRKNIQARWTEISRCAPWLRELAHEQDGLAEDLGLSQCWGRSPGTSLREPSWVAYSSIHLTDTWLADILPLSVAHQQVWFRIKKHFCTAVRSCD